MMEEKKVSKDRSGVAEIRARLARVRGKEYWRSLEERSESDVFPELLQVGRRF